MYASASPRPRPASNVAALAVYRELYAQLVGGVEALGEPVEPTPAITAYLHALLDRWPDITEDAGENSPWSDGPLIDNARGNLFYFGMVFSMADEASEVAAQLASQRGLVCFDPQRGRLRPFDGADGAAADVSLPTVTCASCGKPIKPDEPVRSPPPNAGTCPRMHPEQLLTWTQSPPESATAADYPRPEGQDHTDGWREPRRPSWRVSGRMVLEPTLCVAECPEVEESSGFKREHVPGQMYVLAGAKITTHPR